MLFEQAGRNHNWNRNSMKQGVINDDAKPNQQRFSETHRRTINGKTDWDSTGKELFA